MQTFSSNRKHGLRVLLKLHKVPVKKRETGMAQKKKGKRHQQLQNRYNRQTKNCPKVQKNKNLPVISADCSDFLIFGV